MIKILIQLFERDLNRLKKDLHSFPNEEELWKVKGEVTNSPGNLTLHLVGNLQHFIGAVLGKTRFVRNRKAEFNDKNIPIEELNRQIDTTLSVIRQTLESLPPESLEENYPLQVFGYQMTTGYFLVHLQGHLNYHLGQINYFRRML